MERLTFDGNFCDIAQCRELPCQHGGNCSQKQVWERLKAYEDTGLGPEEVISMQAAKVALEASDAPAADVAPVVHGRWRYFGFLLECQSCGEIYSRHGGNGGKLWNFCPNCGAKMDGGGEDEVD